MSMFAVRVGLISLISILLMAERLYAQDSLESARDLYASARYDEALMLLNRLSSAAPPSDERQSIDLYRTLCLLAVGRRLDADRAIEAIISRDPLYRLSEDVPPRTRTAFTDAKRRLLPTIVQQQYGDAKRAFDGGQFDVAAVTFRRVIDALNDSDMGPAAKQPPLSDLRTLAVGFHDLSVKAIEPPPPPPPPPPTPVTPEPAPVVPPKIYTGEEAGLRPPGIISQEMPRYPGLVPLSGLRGIVEVVIDERGGVESAGMVAPVTTAYDKMVLTAASRWQFQPATLNGTPVKFRKRIQIFIAPPTR
jgi:TonB family protein